MREYFLFSDRIAFSRWNEQDIDLAVSLWGDCEVTKYISAAGFFTGQDIENRLKLEIDSEKRYGVQYWPLFERGTDEFTGCCGLRPYQIENRIYELGFHLRRAYWGKGLANEAANAVIGYAFDTLGAGGLFAGHNPNNVKSKKVLERLGFVYVGDEYYQPTKLYHPSYKLSGKH